MKVKNFITYLIVFSSITTSISSCNRNDTNNKIPTYKVEKTNFEVLVTDTGEISSEIENKIYAPFSTKVDSIIDEGLTVKKGQKVATLETVSQEQSRDESKLSLKEAKLDFNATKFTNEESIEGLKKELKNANLDIDIAKLGLKNLIETRDKVGIIKAEQTLKTIDKELKIYELNVKEEERLNKLGYISQEELNDSKTKLQELQKEKEYTKISLKVLKNGPRKEDIEKEKININIALKNQEKVKQELDSTINKSKLDDKEKKLSIKKSQTDFDYNNDLAEKGNLISPSNGLIIYGKIMSGQDEVKIKAGDSVSQGVEIAKVVDLNKPMLKMLINEVDIGRLKLDQEARFALDAYPEKIYHGKVIKISSIADSKFTQDDNKVKVVEVLVRIFEKDKFLIPGMTANAEIVVANEKNVLAIPSQAIKKDKDKTFCFVKTEKGFIKKPVVIGESNEIQSIIENGLSENDIISLDTNLK